ncbi:two-component regulator propeller domain-containing protein, partial [Bacteroidota bacterium]
MINLKMLTLVFLLFINIHSQQIGTWNNFTDMKNITQTALTSDGFWAVTEGGAFFYNTNDQNFELFTKSSGLSSHILTSLAIDSEGKIWFGTQEGIINVLNPSTSTIDKILDIYNSDKNQKRIYDLFISGDTVFVSTSFGLSLINSNSYSFYETIVKFGDFPAETSVHGSLKEGLIYVCTGRGVAVQKEGTVNLSAPESWDAFTVNANITHKIILWNNTLAAATDNGVYYFDGNNWQQLLFQGNDIKDLTLEGETLYILLENSLYTHINNSTNLVFEYYIEDLSKLIVQNGIYYISTTGGVFEVINGLVNAIFPNSPGSNSFQALSVDEDKNVWVGSGRDEFGIGIFNFDGSEWTNYNLSNTPEFLSNAFHKVYTAPDNTKYFSNWGNGFTRLRDGVFETFSALNTDLMGIPEATNFVVISDIMNDSQNNTWILNYWSANRKPLSVLTSDDQWYHYEFTDPLITDNMYIEHMVVDQYDTKWFAVTVGNRGLYYFNENSTFSNLTDDIMGYVSSAYFESDLITALAVDKRGELWVGTNSGLNIIRNPNQPTSQITRSFGLSQQTINAIVVDPLNRKWVGTNQGLFLMTQDGIRIIENYNTQNSPLPSNQVLSLAIDKNSGILYIGSDFGMTSLSTEAVQPVESFSEIFVYPNPFYIGPGETVELT